MKPYLLLFSTIIFGALVGKSQELKGKDNPEFREISKEYTNQIFGLIDYQGDYDSAIYWCEQAMIEFRDRDEYYYYVFTRYKGVCFSYIPQTDSALYYLNLVLNHSNDNQDYLGMASVLIDMGNLFKYQEKLDSATHYYIEAAEINKNINNLQVAGVVNNNIGLIKYRQADYSVAIDYFDEALKAYEANKDSSFANFKRKKVNNAYLNLTNCYRGINEYDKALAYCDKIIASGFSSGDTTFQAEGLTSKSAVLREMGRARESVNVALLGFELIKEKSPITRAAHVYNLTLGYRDLKNYDSSAYFGNIGLKEAFLDSNVNQIISFHDNLRITYELAGNYKMAYDHLKQYNVYNNPDLDAERYRTIEEIEHKYRAEQKANQIRLLEEEAHNQKFLFIIVVISLLFILLVSFIIRTIRKNRRELAWSKERNEISAQIVYGAENERNRISRDLHDSIGSGLASLHLLLEKIKRNPNTAIDEALEQTKVLGTEVRGISHQLAPYKIEQEGLTFALEDFVSFINSSGSLSIKTNLSSEANKLSNTTQILIYRIVQELIQNILKHSQASKVQINLERSDNFFTLILNDNGVGFDTNPEKYGIGLNNITARLKYVSAEMTINSKKGKGSLFDIKIPV